MESRGIPINDEIGIEIGITTRGDGHICNKCRYKIIDMGDEIVKKIKEEFENEKKSEEES